VGLGGGGLVLVVARGLSWGCAGIGSRPGGGGGYGLPFYYMHLRGKESRLFPVVES